MRRLLILEYIYLPPNGIVIKIVKQTHRGDRFAEYNTIHGKISSERFIASNQWNIVSMYGHPPCIKVPNKCFYVLPPRTSASEGEPDNNTREAFEFSYMLLRNSKQHRHALTSIKQAVKEYNNTVGRQVNNYKHETQILTNKFVI